MVLLVEEVTGDAQLGRHSRLIVHVWKVQIFPDRRYPLLDVLGDVICSRRKEISHQDLWHHLMPFCTALSVYEPLVLVLNVMHDVI